LIDALLILEQIFYYHFVWFCCGKSSEISIIMAGIQTNLLVQAINNQPLDASNIS